MTFRHIIKIVFVAFLFVPSLARSEVFSPTTFDLDNGLKVVVVSNHRAPVVMHMVWYRVGRADEPPGLGGLSHFLEHLMFKGTERFNDNEMARIVSRNGGRENAFTSWDYTGYYQIIAADRLALVMELEADRMRNLRLTAEDIETERKVIFEERAQRIGNSTAARLNEAARATLFINHPYGQPIIGWEEEIAAYDREDLRAHYDRWYCAGNAVLVVVGDVEADEVRRLAETFYGPQTCASPPPKRLRPPSPKLASARQVILRDADVGQPMWKRQWLAPSAATAKDGISEALTVLNEVLSGGATSRLYRGLVLNGGPAASAGASYNGIALNQTSFAIAASPRPGVAVDKVAKAAEAEVSRLLAEGVGEDEVARAKQRLLDEAVFARDSMRTAAFIFGKALTTGNSVEEVESWPERIAAVTAEGVDEAARAVLSQPGHVTSVLLPVGHQAPGEN